MLQYAAVMRWPANSALSKSSQEAVLSECDVALQNLAHVAFSLHSCVETKTPFWTLGRFGCRSCRSSSSPHVAPSRNVAQQVLGEIQRSGRQEGACLPCYFCFR